VRLVLLCRDGVEGRYLAWRLAGAGRLDGLVIEDGGPARRRKLRRTLRASPRASLPLRLLDLLAVTLYGRLMRRALHRRVLPHEGGDAYPGGVPTVRVADGNDEACLSALSRLAPDVLVVSGTAILRAPVLATPRRYALNVHGGLVPGYRNVHSDAWAVLRGEPERVGTSLLHLDEGIDSGAVALQRAVNVEPGDTIADLRAKNLALGADLVLEALEQAEQGSLAYSAQRGEGGFHPTPGLRDLLRLAWLSRPRQAALDRQRRRADRR
jgi:methionyl-tRNA formyltransferase